MESQGDQILREMTEAAAREMEFYRELKRRRMVMSIWKPKAELTPQQEIAYRQSTCDPLLREVAKTVLEEVQANRNERKMAYRVLIYVMIFVVIILVTIPTVIIWAVKKPTKHKY